MWILGFSLCKNLHNVINYSKVTDVKINFVYKYF